MSLPSLCHERQGSIKIFRFIRILHIIKSLGRGGAETLLVENLRLSQLHNVDYHYLYFLPWKNQLVPELEQYGGKVTCLPARNNLQMMTLVQDVRRYIRQHQISLVHAHLPWAGLVARLACKGSHVPLIYTEHNKQERYHWATRLLNKWTFGMQQQVVAVSNDVKVSIFCHIGQTVPVQTVVNGIDTVKFQRQQSAALQLKEELGIDPAVPVIGTVAVFRQQKRLDRWLELFAAVHRQYPQVRGLLVGDGPLRTELQSRANALGLEKAVLFPGLQANSVRWMSAMDIFLMTSDFEGMPLALLEAMSSGCAVVSTSVGGVPEVISHGKNGLLAAAGDDQALEQCIVDLVNDPARRMQLAAAGRQTVQAHYSLTGMVDALESLYKNILGTSHKG